MKLEGDFLFDAPVDEVFSALLDPIVLAAVMPGCEKLDRVDGQYQGELNIKVGPIQGKFSGKVDLTDIDEPKGYTMLVEGRGAPGFVKATATVKLATEGPGTRLRYDADAQVGGKIASVGQRLIEAAARAVSKQSLEGLNDNIKLRVAARAAAAAPERPEKPEKVEAAQGDGAVETSEPGSAEPAGSPAKDLPAPPETGAAAANAPPAPAPVVLKQVDQAALAASIAKEVTKTVVRPVLVAAAVGIAIIALWLVLRRI